MNKFIETLIRFCIALLLQLHIILKLALKQLRNNALEIDPMIIFIGGVLLILIASFSNSLLPLLIFIILFVIGIMLALVIKILPPIKKFIKYLVTTWKESKK